MVNTIESLRSICHVLIMIIIFFIISSTCSASLISYNVANYGARPGSTTDSSEAFVTAWNLACKAPQPATLYVPPSRFFLKSVKFQGPCKSSNITIKIDGTMVAPSDYNVIGDYQSWLYFKNVDGLTITGGILDGQGRGLWDCKNNMSVSNCPRGATSLLIVNSSNIEINGLTSMDSQLFHIVINLCNHVKLQGVQISAAGDSPNTDGIHVQQSAGVTILTSMIATGDDCVSVGPGTNNLSIENVNCGPGHGISIGSLGKDYEEAGVQNVTVKMVTFSGTQNGARIKSWARPSTGFVRNVVFEDITVENAGNPIIIDQNYCPHNEACPGEASGIEINDVTYKKIHGTSTTKVAVKLDCSWSTPCKNIILDDVRLTYKDKQAEALCSNADGSTSGVVEPSSCLSRESEVRKIFNLIVQNRTHNQG